jgi:hypothetical protein
MHKLQRLGQLEALMHLLDQSEAASPALARYLVSMLLQLVHIPALQPHCCMVLQIILCSILYAAASVDVEQPVAAAGKAASKEAKAAAKAEQEQKLQQQRLAVSLLEELLPPTVASLVQCVERAAAAKQLQQQLLVWRGPVTSLPAPLLAGNAAAVDLPADHPPVRLLLSLLSNPPQPLLHVVQTLDLLPPLRVLAEPVMLQQRLRQGLRLPQQIVQFGQRAAGMAASSRQRLMQSISAQLQCGAAELYVTDAAGANSKPAGAAVGSRRGSSSGGAATSSTAVVAAGLAAKDSSQQPRVDPQVVSAAFKLAKLGTQLGDRGVSELAGQLLALAGPVDPDVITFDAAASAADSSSGGSSSKGLAECTAFPMRAVLQHLVKCLFDVQPNVVAVAQSTLSRLLATPEAAAELKSLQDSAVKAAAATASDTSTASSNSSSSVALLCSYLSVFAEKSSQSNLQLEFDHEAAVQALRTASSPQLWSPVRKPFNSWLCKLCSTLLTACSAVEGAAAVAGGSGSMLLQLLADAAALRPSLAELLLPHALLALCTSDNSGSDLPGIGSLGMSAQLGAAITEGLQLNCSSRIIDNGLASYATGIAGGDGSSSCNGGSVDVRCLSVLLNCLEHARIVHRTAMLAPPGTTNPPPAAAWKRCYCVHVDYLAVAAAALSCKAYFTALLYIEHWCEEQYGKLTLNPAASDAEAAGGVQLQHLQQLQQLAGFGNTAGELQQHQQLGNGTDVAQQRKQLLESMLLELYSNVNEPDGIYAVAAAFSSPASQLHLLRHEQLWASVLGAEDALLQATFLQPQQQQDHTGKQTALLLLMLL